MDFCVAQLYDSNFIIFVIVLLVTFPHIGICKNSFPLFFLFFFIFYFFLFFLFLFFFFFFLSSFCLFVGCWLESIEFFALSQSCQLIGSYSFWVVCFSRANLQKYCFLLFVIFILTLW